MKECKVCGGAAARIGSVYVCERCATRWSAEATGSSGTSDAERAWEALRSNDFERAAQLFDALIFEDGVDHEAHWGRALAKGGIVYVTDLNENKRVPTCNNIGEESFLEDRDVKAAIAKAPEEVAAGYTEQAEGIEKIRLEWVEKASREPSYDVFISYKESDRINGIERTPDSIDAQDLYQALESAGYKVFFSRVSLRDKVSEHYEPYIYNAIRTAKVMIVFGERADYFTSPWIKNEWSRYITRIERGEKRPDSLVVVHKNVNPGDLPDALSKRQAINFASFSAQTTLFRHIEKVVGECKGAKKTVEEKTNQKKIERRDRIAIAELKRKFTYQMRFSNEIELTSYIGEEPEVVIPELEGNTVITSIGEDCFKQNLFVEAVYLPSTVTEIGKNAFASCINLKTVELSDSLESIGEHAFSGCEKLKEPQLPCGLKTIGRYAFSYCYGFKSIEIPDSVNSIDYGAFEYCNNLKHAVIGESLTYLYGTFPYCGSLTQVDFRGEVENIGNSCFSGCKRLEEIELPKSVTVIDTAAFSGCVKLRKITLPTSLKVIGERAFSGCLNLPSIKLPLRVKVGKSAFEHTATKKNVLRDKLISGISKITEKIKQSAKKSKNRREEKKQNKKKAKKKGLTTKKNNVKTKNKKTTQNTKTALTPKKIVSYSELKKNGTLPKDNKYSK